MSLIKKFQEVKKALHKSLPDSLVCRESQYNEIYNFIKNRIIEERSGGIYISGVPGTGKTATVQTILSKLPNDESLRKNKPKIKNFFTSTLINCMGVKNTTVLDAKILKEVFNVKKGVELPQAREELKKKLANSKMHRIVILDEMDQIFHSSRSKDFLLFEWTQVPEYKLIVIGIANDLDLTTRHLPFIKSSPMSHSKAPPAKKRKRGESKPEVEDDDNECKLMNFPPYTKDEIEMILLGRLRTAGAEEIFEESAIKFVAAKVASTNGDMRKALNASRTALDKLFDEFKTLSVLKQTSDDGLNKSTPKKLKVLDIAKVLAGQKADGALPLQHALILVSLIRMEQKSVLNNKSLCDDIRKSILFSNLYSEYVGVCRGKGYTLMDKCEIEIACKMLEDRSLIRVGTSPDSPLQKSYKKKPDISIDFDAIKVKQVLSINGEISQDVIDSLVNF